MAHLVIKQASDGRWGLWNNVQNCWVMRENVQLFETREKCREHWNGILAGGFGGSIA